MINYFLLLTCLSLCNTQARAVNLIHAVLCDDEGVAQARGCWDTKQAGELRGDTAQFIALSSALVLMTQNGNIYRPLTQTATCLLPRYRSKHIAENSQWISQTTNALTALLTKRAQVRFCEVINTCTERWADEYWVTCYVQRCVNMWMVCAQPDGSMSSLLQSIGSSPYVLTHIVGPLAATISWWHFWKACL